MSITCPICKSNACNCNWSRCACWLNENEIRASLTKELQQANQEKQLQNIAIENKIKEELDNATTCVYNKTWAWWACVYCNNYKRYEKYYEDWQCPVRVSLKKLKENV